MVIVLRNEVQMVNKPHGLVQTRMQLGSRKEGRLKLLYAIHQTEPRCAKVSQDFCQLPGIVVCLMGLAIAQIGNAECHSIRKKIIHTHHP